MEMENINFHPGAVLHGNFINYYEFNPSKNRLELIPSSLLDDLILSKRDQSPITLLDVGCNSGEMTEAINNHINLDKVNKVKTFALDLDPVLILRAREKTTHANITYQCLNIMEDESKHELREYLNQFNKTEFDIGFCFAVTMWIHVNYGDEGLRMFLHNIASLVKYLIIEPQPWRCYRSAARRLRRLKQMEFPKFQSLKIRSNVVEYIDEVLTKEMGMTRQEFPGKTKWGRSIVLYKKEMQSM